MYTDQWSWWHGYRRPCTTQWSSWLLSEEGQAYQRSQQRSGPSGDKKERFELCLSYSWARNEMLKSSIRDYSDFMFLFSLSNLVVCKLCWVLQVHLLLPQRCVTCGQGQTAEGVASGAPFLDDWHDVVFHRASQRYTVSTHTNISAAVNNSLWSTLKTGNAIIRLWFLNIKLSLLELFQNNFFKYYFHLWLMFHAHFDKHLVSHRCFGRLSRTAVDWHRLSVSGELQGELLSHQMLDNLSESEGRKVNWRNLKPGPAYYT